MSKFVVSKDEFRARIREIRFWFRLLATIGLGHIYGALGFAVVISVLGAVVGIFVGPYPGSVLWGAAAAVFSLFHLTSIVFMFMLVSMALPTVLMSPLVVASALVLRTNRRETMIYGALVGLFIGWPVALMIYENAAADTGTLLGCAGAGAMFALALWQLCLRPYVPPGRQSLSGATGRWWASQSAVAKFITIFLLVALLGISSIFVVL